MLLFYFNQPLKSDKPLDRKRVERHKMICHMVTHNNSEKRYVGITKCSFKVRGSQHKEGTMSGVIKRLSMTYGKALHGKCY